MFGIEIFYIGASEKKKSNNDIDYYQHFYGKPAKKRSFHFKVIPLIDDNRLINKRIKNQLRGLFSGYFFPRQIND